jgi:hypothetical protein
MNKDYIKVQGHVDLLRDPKTNSIINKNVSEYNEYITRKKLKTQESEKIQNLEKDLSSLKDDINEIKSMLKNIASDFNTRP